MKIKIRVDGSQKEILPSAMATKGANEIHIENGALT